MPALSPQATAARQRMMSRSSWFGIWAMFGMVSGFVAGAFGFGGLFVGAAVLSLIPFVFLSTLRTHRTASPPTHAPA